MVYTTLLSLHFFQLFMILLSNFMFVLSVCNHYYYFYKIIKVLFRGI